MLQKASMLAREYLKDRANDEPIAPTYSIPPNQVVWRPLPLGSKLKWNMMQPSLWIRGWGFQQLLETPRVK